VDETPVSDAVVRDVAGEVSETAIREVLDGLQAYAADSPGVESVDDLVYEWRRAFGADPLVERTAATYYLLVPDRVYRDFAERLSWSAEERAAVERAHELAAVEATDGEAATEPVDVALQGSERQGDVEAVDGPTADWSPLVLGR